MVVISIEGKILLYLYKKKEKVNSNKIAKDLQLNRITVVHALERLEKQNLVKSTETVIQFGKIRRVIRQWEITQDGIEVLKKELSAISEVVQ